MLLGVVGVSGDVYGDRIADGVLRVLYLPLLADLPPASPDTVRMPIVPAGMHFVVRSDLPLATLAPAFRRAVSSIDPRVPLLPAYVSLALRAIKGVRGNENR